MDEDDRELIVRLCTRAGMMMEDASAVAIGTAGVKPSELVNAVNDLVTAAADIQKVVGATAVLVQLPKERP